MRIIFFIAVTFKMARVASCPDVGFGNRVLAYATRGLAPLAVEMAS
jgi:hypothetical protein